MRFGRRIAFDIGKARIGVAVSDAHGILASPRDFIPRKIELSETITAMVAFIDSEEAIEVYVGLPTNLRNEETLSTADSLLVATALAGVTSVPVRLIDERLTTKIATGSMRETGQTSRQQRSNIDSAAACVILEDALKFELANAQAAGFLVSEYQDGK